MKQVIILNYNDGIVYIVLIPRDIEDIDEYLYKELGFKESEISYMVFNGNFKLIKHNIE